MRVLPKPLRRYPWYLRPFFWSQERKYGEVLQPALLWARVPRLFFLVAALSATLDRKRSPIGPLLRALVMTRVSQINSCRFCMDLNSATVARRAGSLSKVEALEHWHESRLFSPQEKAVLEYAEAMSYPDRRVDDSMRDRLREFLSDDALVELTALVAFQNLSSKFNSALDVPAQGFCVRLR